MLWMGMAHSVAGDGHNRALGFIWRQQLQFYSVLVTHENAVLRLEEPMPSAHCPEMTKNGHGIFRGTLMTG